MKIHKLFIATAISLGLVSNSFALLINKSTPSNTRMVNATQKMSSITGSKGHYLITSKTIRSPQHPIRMGAPVAKPTATTKTLLHNQRNSQLEE